MADESPLPDIGSLYQEIGSRVRMVRQARDLTHKELADLVGMSRTSVVQLEGGHQRIPLETLYAFASALAIEIGHLLPEVSQLRLELDIVEVVRNDAELDTAEREALVSFFTHARGLK